MGGNLWLCRRKDRRESEGQGRESGVRTGSLFREGQRGTSQRGRAGEGNRLGENSGGRVWQRCAGGGSTKLIKGRPGKNESLALTLGHLAVMALHRVKNNSHQTKTATDAQGLVALLVHELADNVRFNNEGTAH